jgi:asparaginyl-tRNA synthetase
MNRIGQLTVKELLNDEKSLGQEVVISGWVRAFRNDRFIALNDGSTILNLQCVLDPENTDAKLISRISISAAVQCTGMVVESQGKGQSIEIQVTEIVILGDSDAETYPIQPKKHSMQFLREHAHLRFRTNTFGAVFRIRHQISFAIHEYFHNNGFFYFHSPIITASDAEGAGEMFRVTTLDDTKGTDPREDFFSRVTNLTVSGQLEAELGATALGKVYTFGPTFRAENSNTTRHLAEFWMIEPEIAFADQGVNMDMAEGLCKHVLRRVLDNCANDLEFLDQRYAQEESQKPQNLRSSMGLIERLKFVLENPFERISYSKAIEILQQSKPFKKKKFEFPVEWGSDLQSEHERYLVEKHFNCPVIVNGYPAAIKSFYMRLNDAKDDGYSEKGETVAAMDVLFPGIGEIIGGSQREERLDKLQARMDSMNIPQDEMWWYLDTRKFGTVPHAGFGLGLERLVQFVTGMGNIRDVIPFPRTPGSAEF